MVLWSFISYLQLSIDLLGSFCDTNRKINAPSPSPAPIIAWCEIAEVSKPLDDVVRLRFICCMQIDTVDTAA